MNGTEDPFVPYNGGDISPRLFPRLSKRMKLPNKGKVLSTDATIEFWLQNNGIKTKGSVTKLPDINPKDGSTVERTEWTNKNTHITVILYKIIGSGHTWPGAKQYLPIRTIDKTNQDITASKKIWEFFSQHPKYAFLKK